MRNLRVRGLPASVCAVHLLCVPLLDRYFPKSSSVPLLDRYFSKSSSSSSLGIRTQQSLSLAGRLAGPARKPRVGTLKRDRVFRVALSIRRPSNLSQVLLFRFACSVRRYCDAPLRAAACRLTLCACAGRRPAPTAQASQRDASAPARPGPTRLPRVLRRQCRTASRT